MENSASTTARPYALAVKTTRQADGHFRTDWRTSDRHGYVLTQPPAGSDQLTVAELLGLHAVTGLIRPLRTRDFQRNGTINISVPAIKALLSGGTNQTDLEPYLRFVVLSLNDLPIEMNTAYQARWVSHPTEHQEALELVRNDPWDDPIDLPGGKKATLTLSVIEQIQAFLKTSKRWKAWASLYHSSSEMLCLPWPAEAGGTGAQYLCPKFGWVLVVDNERVVDVHGAREDDRQVIVASSPASQPNKRTKAIPVVSQFLQDKPASVTERCRLIREFVSAQTEYALESLLREELPKISKAISLMLDTVLDSVARPIERATILRTFVSALPTSLSYLSLPDGTKAAITGHAIDRLMTRFNVRSPIRCLRMLHRNAGRLRVAQLPVLIQVSHQVHYLTTSTHWRFQHIWTLVETNGVIVTAYYPPPENPAYAKRSPGFR